MGVNIERLNAEFTNLDVESRARIGNTYWVGKDQTVQGVIDGCSNPTEDNPYEVCIPWNRRNEGWTDVDHVTVATLSYSTVTLDYADDNAAIKGGLTCGRLYHVAGDVKVLAKKILIMKDADADQTVGIILSLPAGKSLVIDHGDTNSTNVSGPETIVTHNVTYGDTNAHEILISGDLDSVTYFMIENDPISRIYNIHYLLGVTYLRLNDNLLTGIGDVSALTSLTYLRLTNNLLTDIGNISNLTDLITVYLRNNSLTDIGDISGLTDIVTLRLDDNALTSIGNVSGFTGLTSLYLDINSLSSFTLSNTIDQLYENRIVLGAASCAIKIETNIDTPSCDTDAVAKIEGTGDYLNDGLKQAGCTVTYDA